MKKGFFHIHVRMIAGIMIGILFFLLFFQLIQQQYEQLETDTTEKTQQRIVTGFYKQQESIIFPDEKEFKYDCDTKTLFLDRTSIAFPQEDVYAVPSTFTTKRLHSKKSQLHYPFFIAHVLVMIPEEQFVGVSGTDTTLIAEAQQFFPEDKSVVKKTEEPYPLFLQHTQGHAVGMNSEALLFLEKTASGDWHVTATREQRGVMSAVLAVASGTVQAYDCAMNQVEERAAAVAQSYAQKAQTLSCRSEEANMLMQELQNNLSHTLIQKIERFNEELKTTTCQTLY